MQPLAVKDHGFVGRCVLAPPPQLLADLAEAAAELPLGGGSLDAALTGGQTAAGRGRRCGALLTQEPSDGEHVAYRVAAPAGLDIGKQGMVFGLCS
jgi:hypothetical protein